MRITHCKKNNQKDKILLTDVKVLLNETDGIYVL